MFPYSASFTDQYQLTMAEAYFLAGRAEHHAVFDYFFRKIPFGGQFTVFAGLEYLLDVLQDLRFTSDDLQYLRKQGMHSDFIDYLADFRFKGTLYAPEEGELVFAREPVILVEGGLLECQLIESLLLNIINFQSLIATKAARLRRLVADKTLLDFGLRRAQGAAAYEASRAAVVGGFDGSSHVMAGKDFDFPVSGTMAHSFVQGYDSELEAFRVFSQLRPKNCVLLVDTYNTLKQGVPNAITVALEMKQRGDELMAIRLDSGDLLSLSKQARAMLDDAGLNGVKIAASNQLDEHSIKKLVDEGAPIDIFGVGTSLVTGMPDAALDGVYKLALLDGVPRIKLSEHREKMTLPGKKQVFRHTNAQGLYLKDTVMLASEDKPKEGFYLLKPVMKDGQRQCNKKNIKEIRAFCLSRLQMCPDKPYIVDISEALSQEQQQLIGHIEA